MRTAGGRVDAEEDAEEDARTARHLPVVAWTTDLDGVITMSQGTGLERLGLEPGELEGRSVTDVYGPSSSAVRDLHRALAGESFRVDAEYPGGELTTWYQPLRGDDGAVVGMLGITVDVTEQRVAQDLRRRQVLQATALAELSAAWHEGVDLPDLLAEAARAATVAVGSTGVAVRLLPSGARPALAAGHHPVPAAAHALRDAVLQLDDEALRRLVSVTPPEGEGEVLVDPHAVPHPDPSVRRWRQAVWDVGVRRRLRVPLLGRHGALGLMLVVGEEPGAYADDERRVAAEVASRVALAVENAALVDRLRVTAAARAELIERLVDAQEVERSRVADDIHDDTVQVLAALDLRLGLLRRRLAADTGAQQLVDACLHDLHEAGGRLRELMFDLDAPARRQPLTGALRSLAAHVLRDADLDWEVQGPAASAPGRTVDLVAYRVVQEALANVVAHARASRVVVEVGERGGVLEVVVEDDGRGIPGGQPLERTGHRGTRSMRERAAAAGGTVEWERAPDGGTRVRCWLPVGAGAD